MTDRHHQDYPAERLAKIERLGEALKARQIGDNTFLRSLMILGVPLDEARIELRRLK